jgi:hypothetical protein
MKSAYFGFACMALAGTALAGLTAETAGAQPLQAGVLECNVAPGVGVFIGSSKDVSCIFRHHGKPEFYAGRISRIGVDVGVTGPARLSWGVYANVPPGSRLHWALAGDYSGLGAGLAVGPGGTANSLVGGVNNAISLVPLSGTTEGLAVSAGIGALSLQPASMPPRPTRGPG